MSKELASSKIVERQNGRKGVKIQWNKYGEGWDVRTMRNGFQWSGFTGDRELLTMLREALNELFAVETPQVGSNERGDSLSGSETPTPRAIILRDGLAWKPRSDGTFETCTVGDCVKEITGLRAALLNVTRELAILRTSRGPDSLPEAPPEAEGDLSP